MDWSQFWMQHWDVKITTVMLIWAAWIDGKELRVPNWMTYSMMAAGLLFNFVTGGVEGLGQSGYGIAVGMACLLPLYAVGGMGAGDVKLMGGMGSFVGAAVTWHAFTVSVVVGAIMAVIMVLWRNRWEHHYNQFWMLWGEWFTVRNPVTLHAIAKERKPTMMLLPYGIPICIGSIGYFLYAGLM